ncbi:pre-mRNA-splicing factor 18-like [Mytilus edulis]|uniref:Pre-mRNA-splicing factor 18 n=1 Tax=Mytilus edulis TaxID=6550 RepID=A0A8S3UH91_MYTED|nr:PRP18 [Mytilus edulis]
MDFKALIQAEIEKKKRKVEKNSDILSSDKKYFKRGDLAKKEEEEYWKKHQRLKVPEKLAKTKEEQKEEEKKILEEDEQKYALLPRKEVVRKLRERGEPILLFGETDYEAYVRLKKLETFEPDGKKGEGSDFKMAMDRVDQDYLNEIVNAATSEGGEGKLNVVVRDDGTTLDDIEKMQEELAQGDSEKDMEICLKFLKYILKGWGDRLNNKPQEEKTSRKGREEYAIQTQTVAYMKPLFKNLKHKKVEDDILDPMVSIIKQLLKKDYIKANDAYLEMAIGNAPWPIGVTMVGIHARTGREKISSRYVAHVLNDETQRKYLQGLKRLMTQCQRLFPTAPSRSVNYEREKDA